MKTEFKSNINNVEEGDLRFHKIDAYFYRTESNRIVAIVWIDGNNIEVKTAAVPYGELSIYKFNDIEKAKEKALAIYKEYAAIYGEY